MCCVGSLPTPGYYSEPVPGGRYRYWNGREWTRVYWRWWRIVLTAVPVATAAVVVLGLFFTVYGDPGPGGWTAAQQHHTNTVADHWITRGGATVAVLAVVAIAVHLPAIRRLRRRHTG
jgi:hypothetical protein